MNEALAPNDAMDETRRLQNLASDPRHSAWVSANAGSGKTHVLTQRVIRLMLAGARPSSILCLTYTKAAASEMSNRVFDRLSRWTAMDDAALSAEIEGIEGVPPDRITLANARKLFARALETPGGLKIQTIHAFCEALLHQFPLEANVAGHFSVLDDKAAAALISEARRSLLTATQAGRDGELAAAFHDVLTIADETGLDRLLSDIVSNRSALQRFFESARREGTDLALKRGLGIAVSADAASIAARAWPLAGLGEARMQDYVALANGKGGANAQERAYALGLARSEADPVRRLELLRAVLLKKSDEQPYAATGYYTSAMNKIDPDLCEAIVRAATYLSDVWQDFKVYRMFEATRSALVLARHFLASYEALKKERSFLDFEDFITRTDALLRKSDIGPWVHYKLDQGIDHLLLDEAQDTSPTQWSIIMSLTEEFFSGASARTVNRTLFTVGDEKQSIYSFQGARPERFASERRRAEARALAGRKHFEPLELHLSFRSTEDVLSAVDQVFAREDNRRGLSAEGRDVIHQTNRIGQAGAVDLWEIIAEEGSGEEDEDWLAPFDRPAEKSSVLQLAIRMAAAIREMIGRDVLETKEGPRPVGPGDILVLVRKRDAFAGALARELKRNGAVPVAGTDRLVLASHIAIQDMMALGRFALLSEDDLSLAALIKSPLFDMAEEDVDALCGHRAEGQRVWERLRELAGHDPRWKAVETRLLRWVEMACAMRVHDFYAALLGAEGGRKLFLSRFGHEVSDVLDEFLNFALAHEEAGLPGLTSFIATLEKDSPEIKREQDKGRDEVRIMTVHASKGLEAPVVFLVDGGSKPFDKGLLPKLRLKPGNDDQPDIPFWVPVKDVQSRISSADDDRLGRAAEEEYRRLLYVGLTRASDRLVISGYRRKRDVPDSWAQLARMALVADETRCVAATFSAGGQSWEGLRWRHHQREPAIADAGALRTDKGKHIDLPDSLLEPLPPMLALPRPLAPSGVTAVIDEADGDLIVPSALFADRPGGGGAQVRGKIVHRLLQALPELAPGERAGAAQRYLSRAAPHWSEADRTTLADGVIGIVGDNRFAALFGEGSRAEVSVMGTVRVRGRDYAISGRVDRMGVSGDRVFVTDYKTNRVPPATREAIPFAHRAQLALYREVLSPLFPGKTVECLLVYTEGPHLYSLSPEELGKALLDISAG
ncbi:MAG: double-strand break repair helicase AddA [Rhizobium sp.]|nr:double-strand break repair helicase AddA [Rhizobium sp.]